MSKQDHADEFISTMISSEGGDEWRARAKYRALFRRSLFYAVKTTICWDKVPNLMTQRTFLEVCNWVQSVITTVKRGLLEDPRNHAKSTIANEGVPIWVAAQRPHEDYDHPNEIARCEQFLALNQHIKGPDTRIVVAAESKDVAQKKWGNASLQHWENNLLLRWGFPELLWDNPNTRDYGHWSESAYSIPGRKFGTVADDFFRVLGIKSRASGGRADIILIDDLVSEESNESPTELAYRCKWLLSITQIMENRDQNSPAGSAVLYINNHWNFNDPNTMIHDEKPHWSIWHRACWVCGVHGRGNCGRQPSNAISECTPTDEPLWPERHSDLDGIRADLGDLIFYTQWGNCPSRKVELNAAHYIPFHMELINIDERRQWCAVINEQRDSEGLLTHPHEIVPIAQLSLHTLSIDPAGADEESEARKKGKTARWCGSWFAFDPPAARIFCLDARADHWAPDDAIEELYQMWREASQQLQQPLELLCEKVACQTIVGTALKFRAQADSVQLPKVEGAKRARGGEKDVRIRQRLGIPLGNRRIYLREGLLLPRIETRNFPTGSKDWLDTFSQIMEKYQEMMGVNVKGGSDRRARRRNSRRRRIMNAGATGV